MSKKHQADETETNTASIYLSEAENYWKEYRAASLQVASGVLFISLSFASFLFFCSAGYVFMGISCLIFGIALAVGFYCFWYENHTFKSLLHHRKIPEKY